MEVTEDLFIDGIKIIQNDKLYRFTSDSVLLSKFATVKPKDVVADFCAGSGIVGLHLYALHNNVESVTFFEMQKSLFDMSMKSVALNGLENKFFGENLRLQDIGKEYNEHFSLIVCNPPYMEKDSGKADEEEHIAICKREITLSAEELIDAAAKSLKFGGRLALVHRADRLTDILFFMRKKNIEPKRLQFVSGAKKAPYLFMVEGVKGGKKGIKILSTLEN